VETPDSAEVHVHKSLRNRALKLK